MAYASGAPDDSDRLIAAAAAGDAAAIELLLQRHRERLRRMIARRIDDRLAARVDASDVVQEALADAARKLPDYLRVRPLPFYPWLHRLAAERLAAEYRRHLRSTNRSVAREEVDVFAFPDSSAQAMARNLVASGTSPEQAMLRDEQRRRVHAALRELAPIDREILMLHYLDELSLRDIAAILGIGEGAAKMRHLRALQRIRALMATDGDEGSQSR